MFYRCKNWGPQGITMSPKITQVVLVSPLKSDLLLWKVSCSLFYLLSCLSLSLVLPGFIFIINVALVNSVITILKYQECFFVCSFVIMSCIHLLIALEVVCFGGFPGVHPLPP